MALLSHRALVLSTIHPHCEFSRHLVSSYSVPGTENETRLRRSGGHHSGQTERQAWRLGDQKEPGATRKEQSNPSGQTLVPGGEKEQEVDGVGSQFSQGSLGCREGFAFVSECDGSHGM